MTMASEQVFHTGDSAWYVFGGREVQVEVIEERGPIGVGGRHLVRIRKPLDYAEPLEFTVAEADLRPITGAA
jgi:hypothetical protein